MKQENKKKILRPNPGKIILTFIVIFFVFEAIFYLSFQAGNFFPLSTSFYYYTPCLVVATIIFCVLSISKTNYEIQGSKLIHNKMGKSTEIIWNDIIYIDEEFSEQHKMLLFYTKDGRDWYLAFDKNGEIYEIMKAKTHPISLEEMQRRFPNKKL